MKYSWTISKFIKPRRTILWYLAVAAIFLGAVIYGLKTKDLVFVTTFLFVLGILVIHDMGHSEKITVVFDDKSLKIGEIDIRYEKLSSFKIFEDAPKRLLIETRLAVRPFIEIELAEMTPEKIRKFLSGKINEDDELDYDLTGKLIRLLKL